jgi:hypothetical protein
MLVAQDQEAHHSLITKLSKRASWSEVRNVIGERKKHNGISIFHRLHYEGNSQPNAFEKTKYER